MAKRKKPMIRGYNVDGSAMTEDDFLNHLEVTEALARRLRARAARWEAMLENHNGPPFEFMGRHTPASLIADAEDWERMVAEQLERGGL